MQRLEAVHAADKVDKAAAEVAQAAQAAQMSALTAALTALTTAPAASSAASPPSSASSAAASSPSTSPPPTIRAQPVLGVDPARINDLIASLSSTGNSQVPHTRGVQGMPAAARVAATAFGTATAPADLSSPNPFQLLLNDELTAATPGRPEHLIHALTTALTEGTKAAKRFKTKDEFSKALTAQFQSFVAASSPPSLLSAWYRYTVFLLSLDFQQAQDYHFELSHRMKAGEHDLLRDGHMNTEVYCTCVIRYKHSGGGSRADDSTANGKSKPAGKFTCDYHGLCGHTTADCKRIGVKKDE